MAESMSAAVLLLVCTFAFPHGGLAEAIQEPSCPPFDMGNDSGFTHDGRFLQPCVRRFKV